MPDVIGDFLRSQRAQELEPALRMEGGLTTCNVCDAQFRDIGGALNHFRRKEHFKTGGAKYGGGAEAQGGASVIYWTKPELEEKVYQLTGFYDPRATKRDLVVVLRAYHTQHKKMMRSDGARDEIRNSVVVIENLKKLARENPDVQSLVVKMARLNDALKKVMNERHQLQLRVLFYEKKGATLNNYAGSCSGEIEQLRQKVAELEQMNVKLKQATDEHKKEGKEIVMKLKNLNVVGNGGAGLPSSSGVGNGAQLQQIIDLLTQRQELGYRQIDAQARADGLGVRNFEREAQLQKQLSELNNQKLRLEQQLVDLSERVRRGSVGAQQRLEQLKDEINEKNREISGLQTDLDKCKRASVQMGDAQQEANELKRKLRDCEAKLARLTGERADEQTRSEGVLRRAQEETEEAKRQLAQVQAELKDVRTEQQWRSMGTSRAEMESRRSIQEAQEKASQAESQVRALSQKSERDNKECQEKMIAIWDQVNKIRHDLREQNDSIIWTASEPPSGKTGDQLTQLDVVFDSIKRELSHLNSDIVSLARVLEDKYNRATQALSNTSKSVATALENASQGSRAKSLASKLRSNPANPDTAEEVAEELVNVSEGLSNQLSQASAEARSARDDLVSTRSGLSQEKNRLNNEIKELNGKLKDCQEEKEKLEGRIKELEKQKRGSISSKGGPPSLPPVSTQGALEATSRVVQIVGTSPEDQKRLEDLTRENAELNRQKKSLEDKLKDLEASEASLRKRLETAKAETEAKAQLVSPLPSDATPEQIERYNENIKEIYGSLYTLMEYSKKEVEDLKKEEERIRKELNELRTKEETLRSAIVAFYGRLARTIPEDDDKLVDDFMEIYKNAVHNAKNEQARLEGEKQACEEQINELKNTIIPDWEKRVNEAETKLNQLRPLEARVKQLENEVETERGKTKKALERAEYAEAKTGLSAEQLKPITERLNNTIAELNKVKKERDDLQAELTKLQAESRAKEVRLRTAQETELEDEKKRIKNNAIADRNKEVLRRLDALITQLSLSIQVEESVENRITRITQGIKDLGKNTAQAEALQAQIATLEGERDNYKAQVERLERNLKSKDKDLEAKEKSLTELQNSLAQRAQTSQDEVNELHKKITKLVSISNVLVGKEGGILDEAINGVKANLTKYEELKRKLKTAEIAEEDLENEINRLQREAKKAKEDAEKAKRDAEDVRQGALKQADQRVKELETQKAKVEAELEKCNEKVKNVCKELQKSYNSVEDSLKSEIDKLERTETGKKPPSRERLKGLFEDSNLSYMADKIWDTYSDIKNRGNVKPFNAKECQDSPSRAMTNWGQLKALQGQFNAIRFILEESRKSIEGSAMLQQCSSDIDKFQARYAELANAIGWLKGIIKTLERKRDNPDEYRKLTRYLKQGKGNPEWYRQRLQEIDTSRKAIISNAQGVKSGITKENLLSEVEKIKSVIQVKKGMKEVDIKTLETKYKSFCSSLNRLITEVERTITKDFSEALLNEFEDVSGTVRVYIRLNDVFYNTPKGGKSLSSWVQTERKGNECSRSVNFDGRVINQGSLSFGPFYGVFMCASNEDIFHGVTAGTKEDFCASKRFPNGTQDCKFTFESSKGLSAVLRQALDGYKIAVFGYGYSGSGKTYTLFGDTKKPDGAKGVIQDTFTEKSEIYQRIVKEGYNVSIEGIYELYGQGMPYLTVGKDPKYSVLYPVVNPIVNSGLLGGGMDSGRTFITPPEIVDKNPPERFPKPSMSDDYYINVVQQAKANIEGLGTRSPTLSAMSFTTDAEKLTSRGASIQRKKIKINNTSEINNVINFIINVVTLRRRLIQRIKTTPNNPESSRGHLFIEIGLEKGGVMGKIVVCDLGGIENPQEILTTIFPSTSGVLQQIILRTKDVGIQTKEVIETLRGKNDMFNLQGTRNINELYEKNKAIARDIGRQIENPEVLTDVLIEANSFAINQLRGIFNYREQQGSVKMTNNIKKFIETYGISYEQINKLVSIYVQIFTNPQFNQQIMDGYLETKVKFALDLVKEGFYINETLNHMKTYFQFQKGIDVRLLSRAVGASVNGGVCSALDTGKSPNSELSGTFKELLPPFNATDSSLRPYSPNHMFWNPIFQYTKEKEVRVEFCFAEKGSRPDKKTGDDYVGMITALQRINFSQSDSPSKFVMLSMIRPDYDGNDLRYYYGALATLSFAEQIASTTLK